MKSFSGLNVSSELKAQLEINSKKCIKCKLCQKECAFLRKYGKPKDIADTYNPDCKAHQRMPFECSLCQICSAACPVHINPAHMFLEMRRETVRSGNGEYPEHGVIIGYEKRGSSKRYSYYAIPEGCDTVFFPGCTLSGTRPDKVKKLFQYLRKSIPSLGIVLDCCTTPSHDLGRDEHFKAIFYEMRDYLVNKGVRTIIVACPNCYKIFNEYGNEHSVQTVYNVISNNVTPETIKVNGTVTVHDPCAIRFEEEIHSHIRDILQKIGLTIEEMPHSGKKTLCCGEGGSVGYLSPELSRNWRRLIKQESGGKRILTYCAGCANFLNSTASAIHILDLLFDPEATMAGTVKVAKSPFTYLNRIKLKNYFKDLIKTTTTRERTFTYGKEKGKGRLLTFKKR